MKRIPTGLIPALASLAVCLWVGIWIHEQLWFAEVVDAPATGISGLSGIGKVAFLWTIGLQASVMCLILSRQHSKASKAHDQATQVSTQQAQELVRMRNAIIFGMAKLADSRDRETGNHLDRINHYSTRLAIALRQHPDFRDYITTGFIQQLGMAAALHDIGKVGISDTILLKPGPLSPEERAKMQQHTIIGGECIAGIEQRLSGSKFLTMAREVALHHHERWDGAGYPFEISGEDVPLAARIVAIADVYDALAVPRVYKPAFPHEKCVRIIKEEGGHHFDPRMVDVFLTIAPEFKKIASRFADPDQRLTDEISTPDPVAASIASDASTMNASDERLLMSVLRDTAIFEETMTVDDLEDEPTEAESAADVDSLRDTATDAGNDAAASDPSSSEQDPTDAALIEA